MEILQKNNFNIGEIVSALKQGAVLVLPTDTVYGVVCDATNEKAVEKIFEIKKRDKLNTLPVFVGNIEMVKKYAAVNAKQEEFLNKNWPGAVTVVLEKKEGLAPLVYKENTIALRQPKYELVLEIIKELDKPLAQTSANISGVKATMEIKEVLNQFKDQQIQPDIIIDVGDLPKNNPSTIIDLTSNNIKVLRK